MGWRRMSRKGLVTSAETLAEFLAAYLLESAATSDCPGHGAGLQVCGQ